MDNVKNDKYYLGKILADLQFLVEHTEGKTYGEVESDPVLIDCILFRLIQIAENSDKLTPSYKEEHKGLPWREIKGMRNRIVHDYGFIDLTIVYDTVMHGIPEMYGLLKKSRIAAGGED